MKASDRQTLTWEELKVPTGNRLTEVLAPSAAKTSTSISTSISIMDAIYSQSIHNPTKPTRPILIILNERGLHPVTTTEWLQQL